MRLFETTLAEPRTLEYPSANHVRSCGLIEELNCYIVAESDFLDAVTSTTASWSGIMAIVDLLRIFLIVDQCVPYFG